MVTTRMEDLCYALQKLHVPGTFVTVLMLTYRYIIVLLKEMERMTDAYTLRAPGQKGLHYKVWGTMVGQLLLRSMDRAQTVYDSMRLRGYCGEFYLRCKKTAEKGDYLEPCSAGCENSVKEKRGCYVKHGRSDECIRDREPFFSIWKSAGKGSK